MKTHLLLWDPKKWPWATLEQDIEQVNLTGRCLQIWGCGNSTKSIQAGDRVFLMKIGEEDPKGIVASGFASSTPYKDEHWNDKNKTANYIKVEFDVLLNPYKEPILTLDILNAGNLAAQDWTPQSSGNSINPALVDELEALWFEFLTTAKIRHNPA